MNKKKTLNNYHKNVIKKFDKNLNELPKLEKQLANLEKDLIKMEKLDLKTATDAQIEKKFTVIEKIAVIKIKISDYKQNHSSYYLKSFDLLSQYYSESDNGLDIKINKSSKGNSGSLLQFANTSHNNTNKKDIFEKYLETVNDDYISDNITFEITHTTCKNCNIEMNLIYNQSIYICKNCGVTKKILIGIDKTNSSNNIMENTSNYSYKRINHFLEWLNKFQGREKTIIPQSILDQIKIQLAKERNFDIANLTYDKTKKILEICELSKYYDNIFHIIEKLNGNPPPSFSKELENELIIMFKKCQEPYERCRPEERSNFFSYAYIIRKFLELLGYDEYNEYFKYLKSREKLHKQDLIWKDVCKELRWEFIGSF